MKTANVLMEQSGDERGREEVNVEILEKFHLERTKWMMEEDENEEEEEEEEETDPRRR